MQSSQVLRKPLTVALRPRRAPEEHLAARFPGLYARLARWLARLPPSSRIRQALVRRAVEQGLAASNRRDFDAVLPRYDPLVQFAPAPELFGIGIKENYSGHDGFLAFWHDWDSAWAEHAQWDPKELIDLGDRLLMLGRMRGTGEASGIAIDAAIALLWTLRDGRIVREQHYMDPAEALEAVGLARG